MPVNRKEKILFIHIPRTGGTSIEETLGIHGDWRKENQEILFGLDDQDRLLQHLTYDEMTQEFTVNLDKYFKFCVFREPLDKMLSEFRRYRKLRDMRWQTFLEKARSAQRIPGWQRDIVHYRPQNQFLSESLNRIYLFEEIKKVFNDLNELCEREITSRCDNTTSRRMSRKEFIEKHENGVQLLKEVYAKDFEVYNQLK